MVQVFDTNTGALRASLRAGSSNAILSCDISNGVVVGGGSDKTCRVWNYRTQRMVSQWRLTFTLTVVGKVDLKHISICRRFTNW
jgi:WD40 repeat protein